jgi:spermidine/putrescine transport system substrate-binding protein
MQSIDPTLAENQLIFPNESTLATVKGFRTLTNAEQSKYSAQFEAVGLGA